MPKDTTDGSENIPEATDYKAMVEEARAFQRSHEIQSGATAHGGVRRPDHAEQASRYKSYADAVESLLSERDGLRLSFQEAEQIHERVVQRLAAERDALQERLDAMQVEWSAPDTASIETVPFPFGYGTDQEMARRSAAELHGPVYRRLVSEWTVVEGEQP